MDDIFEEGFLEEPRDDEPTVMGYGEMEHRWRAGAEIMATEIEGQGALARFQERIQMKQVGSGVERALLSFYAEVKDIYKKFAPDDKVLMFDKFHTLKNYVYKNPYAYLLAYIGIREGELTKQMLSYLMSIVKSTAVTNVEEADIIRYYRLLNKMN